MYAKWDALASSLSDSEEEDVIRNRREDHIRIQRRTFEPPVASREDVRIGATGTAKDACSLHEYVWYDDERFAHVHVQLPKESSVFRIVARKFGSQSFSIELAATAKSYRFAVAELPLTILPEQCECFVKEDKVSELVIKLVKFGKVRWTKLAC
jgi:hypothetical protein